MKQRVVQCGCLCRAPRAALRVVGRGDAVVAVAVGVAEAVGRRVVAGAVGEGWGRGVVGAGDRGRGEEAAGLGRGGGERQDGREDEELEEHG